MCYENITFYPHVLKFTVTLFFSLTACFPMQSKATQFVAIIMITNIRIMQHVINLTCFLKRYPTIPDAIQSNTICSYNYDNKHKNYATCYKLNMFFKKVSHNS